MKLRFEASETFAIVRKPISIGVMYAIAVAWNLALTVMKPDMFWWVGVLACLLFGYGMARGFANGAELRFEGDRFVCRNGPLPPAPKLVHPIADIDCFLVIEKEKRFKIVLRTSSGAEVELPIDFDSIILYVRGFGEQRPIFGLAPADHASRVATWLNEALDVARRSSTQYRVGIVHEAEDELELERKKLSRR